MAIVHVLDRAGTLHCRPLHTRCSSDRPTWLPLGQLGQHITDIAVDEHYIHGVTDMREHVVQPLRTQQPSSEMWRAHTPGRMRSLAVHGVDLFGCAADYRISLVLRLDGSTWRQASKGYANAIAIHHGLCLVI